jgi:hypothetical protein
MDKLNEYCEGLLDFITNENSRFSIMYGNQEERFCELKDNSDDTEEFTIKEIIELYNKKIENEKN